jgi:hypothetical protein
MSLFVKALHEPIGEPIVMHGEREDDRYYGDE